MRHKQIPDPESITPTTPLRLEIAARLAFPDGGVTASSLRREAARGNLVIERIAGKDFTTLQAIEEMRKRCVLVSLPDSSCGEPAKVTARQSGLSSTEGGKLAQERAKAAALKLSSRSRTTFRKTDSPTSAR